MRSPKNSTLLKVVPETCVCRRPFSSSSFSLCRRLVVSFVFFDVIAFGRRSPRFSHDTASLFFSRDSGPFCTTMMMVFQNRMSRDDHTATTENASTSAISDKTPALNSSWAQFKSKVCDCFWDFEAELADWFGLNASKFYEELEMKEDLEREEEEDRRRREEKDGVEMTKMETAAHD